MKYIIATDGFSPNQDNPYSSDGTYFNFSCFSNQGDSSIDLLTKRTKSGCWLVEYNKNNYRDYIFNFIRYENSYNRTVIIKCDIKDDIEKTITMKIENETPKILVHSTTIIAKNAIRKSKKIKACFYISRNTREIGLRLSKYLNNEPVEYKKYIMLDDINGNSELIMAMYQKDSFDVSENDLYVPGSCIYIDARKLEKDGILIKDGIHIGKVFKEIDLEKYCMKIVSASDFNDISEWTPIKFKEYCNNNINA